MAVEKQYQSDVKAILAKRYDNNWDYWTTPDKRLSKGSPFSTLDCAWCPTIQGMQGAEYQRKDLSTLEKSTNAHGRPTPARKATRTSQQTEPSGTA